MQICSNWQMVARCCLYVASIHANQQPANSNEKRGTGNRFEDGRVAFSLTF